MRALGCFLFFFYCVAASLSTCEQAVVAEIGKALNDPKSFRATWGLNVSRLSMQTGALTPVYSHLANAFITPASNNKLPTTAAAFLTFGAEHTFESSLKLTDDNQLCFVAGGDPELMNDIVANFSASIAKMLDPSLVYELTLDASLFGEQTVPGDWEWDDMNYYYGAPPTAAITEQNVIPMYVISGASVNSSVSLIPLSAADADVIRIDNQATTLSPGSPTTIDFHFDISAGDLLVITGGVAIDAAEPVLIQPATHTPRLRLASVLAASLFDAKISINSTVRLGSCGAVAGSKLLGKIVSNPLRTIMKHTLLVSDNLEAEVFMRHLGANASITGDNYGDGIAAVQKALTALGADASGFSQADGSGLGRMNQLTPSALVSLLAPMRNSEWVSYLPVGGVSGTLADRYVNTTAQGRVFAKTGTLTGVNSLSGYVKPLSDGDSWFVFSIIANGTPNYHSHEIHALVDPIIVAMSKC